MATQSIINRMKVGGHITNQENPVSRAIQAATVSSRDAAAAIAKAVDGLGEANAKRDAAVTKQIQAAMDAHTKAIAQVVTTLAESMKSRTAPVYEFEISRDMYGVAEKITARPVSKI